MFFAKLIASHPTWVRGLKPYELAGLFAQIMSHPTWVRGLKQTRKRDQKQHKQVAPYVGAWIETRSEP